MIIGWILFFSFVQSSWSYQLQQPGNNPWDLWLNKFVSPHIPGYTTTVQPPTITKNPGNNPWNALVEKLVGHHIPGYTTTVQPPTTTKKDMSLIEFVTVSINNFRKEMINGNEILGIPKMEPWTFQKSNLDMETHLPYGGKLSWHILITQGRVEGLSKFKITNIDVEETEETRKSDVITTTEYVKASMVFSIHGVFMDHPYDYKGTATLHLKNITSEVAFDLNNMYENVAHLDSLLMDSKIGNAELTGVAEGVEQKLDLDVTEIVNKVSGLLMHEGLPAFRSHFRKSFSGCHGGELKKGNVDCVEGINKDSGMARAMRSLMELL